MHHVCAFVFGFSTFSCHFRFHLAYHSLRNLLMAMVVVVVVVLLLLLLLVSCCRCQDEAILVVCHVSR